MDLSSPVSVQTKHRVAVLVDGDNFPYKNHATLSAAGSRLGEVTIQRVFGNMAVLKGWATQTAYAATHCTTAAGKNRADMALVVAALDLAHRGLASAFVVASDDRDFDPLIAYLRELGFRVDRVGKPKPANRPTVPKADDLKQTYKMLLDEIKDHLCGRGEVLLKDFGQMMRGEPVKQRTGKASWRTFVNQFPELFEVSGTGPSSTIRLKPSP